jgi:hypothetical protein
VLVRLAPRLISRAYRRSDVQFGHECTRCAWVACEALRRCGIAATPLDCVAEAWNCEFATWQATGVDHPNATLVTNDPLNVDVVLQHGPGNPFLTHLVAHVPDEGLIVDLAAVAHARPKVGILPPPAVALPWDGAEARCDFEWGVLRYRAWPAQAPQPPTLGERRDWMYGATNMGPLAKTLAKKIATIIERRGQICRR